MNRRGLTLIELLITIAIIGILAGAAVTAYIGVAKKTARSEAYTNLELLRLLEEDYFNDNNQTYSPDAVGVTAIQADLPRFQPGSSALFTYEIFQNVALVPPVPIPYDGTTVAQTPCFIATATGMTGTRVEGDVFAIDCNNNKNY